MKEEDDQSSPSAVSKSRTTNDQPLFTCALKLDKYDYEEKVSDE